MAATPFRLEIMPGITLVRLHYEIELDQLVKTIVGDHPHSTYSDYDILRCVYEGIHAECNAVGSMREFFDRVTYVGRKPEGRSA